MENLSQEEKKKIFIKMGISIALLLVVMVIGIILM